MAQVATKRAIAILGGAAVLSAAVFVTIISRQGDNGASSRMKQTTALKWMKVNC